MRFSPKSKDLSTALRVCDFIDFLHPCHAERKRGAGRGGVEAPRVCLRCRNPRHIFGHHLSPNGVVKKLAKPPALQSCMGSFDSIRLAPHSAQDDSGKKSHTLRMTAVGWP